MSTVIVDGCALECVDTGQGEPVVFVHGSASDLRTWRRQQPEFASRYRCVSYSRRYHWPNEPIPAGADYAMREQADDLYALLDALALAPAHLVGHSYGGFLGLLLAAKAPSVVRSLVLVEPPVLPLFVGAPPRPARLLAMLLGHPRAGAAIARFVATSAVPATAAARHGDMAKAMRIFGRGVLGDDAYDRLSPVRLEQVRDNTIAAEFLGSGLAPLDDDEVRDVRCPLLLVTGQRSPALFHRLTDRLAQLLPQAERVDIAGASHIVHEDNAAAFNAAVLAHLRKTRARAPVPAAA